MKKLILLPLSLTLFLAACGGSSSEDVAKNYLAAQQSGNWAVMCSNLDQASQEALRTSLKQAGGKPENPPATCTLALEGATEQSQKAILEGAEGVEVVSVEENGDTAFISSERNGVPSASRIVMNKEGDQWKVSIASGGN